MSTGTPYIGSKISLISKAKIRYEGYLYTIDTDESTVTLAKVQSLGTEDRQVDKKVPARDEIYEYIVFRGTDIDDLHVCEGPKPRSQVPQDPAIVQTGTTSQPGMYPQMQNQMAAQFTNYNAFGAMGPSFGYPFGFRPQHSMPVAGHPHASSVPPMTNFGHKEPEKSFARTPSPPSQSTAPGSGFPFRDVRDPQPAERGVDRQKGERRPAEKGEAAQGDKRKEERVRGADREKGSLKDKDRDRERERDKENRRSRDSERDLKKDRIATRERDSAKDRDAVRDQEFRKERDGTRDRDVRRDRRKEKETEDRKEGNRGFDHKAPKEREEDRNQKERTKDQDFDREERSRRGSGSGGRGRRSTKQGSNRGSSRSGPNAKPKFEEDFDFETANAKFNKEEVERELLSALKKNLTVRDEDEDVIIESESGKASLDEDKDEDEQDGLPSPAKYYDPSKSFYDTISCESKESDGINSNRSNLRRQERERNAETFGPPPRGYRGRGRPFRGRGSRGGRSRGYGRARGGSYDGHYARHSGNRGWVDYDFNFKDAGIEKPAVLGHQS